MTLLSAVPAVEDTPFDRYLAEQADLTAVERFAQRHDTAELPVQARYYRDLIPAATPGPGQQYGFQVDLDACTGCKACVVACHSLNGLDDGESWRSVTLLRGDEASRPLQQTVTAACHHCVEPACLEGCPVDAYEKDPVTGIVSHLDDQCIGCSYCTLTCPYEVPVYNHRSGIVRKCDLCTGRLAVGEAPACVQACPNEAIAVALVDVAGAQAAGRTGSLVPGAPPSSITFPTSRYTSASGRVQRMGAADGAGVAHAHPPLTVMLVLTQLSVGAFTVGLAQRFLSPGAHGVPAPARTVDALVAAVAGVLAIGASTLHLGRPQYFYRAVIGLRHSWLSREVVVFGAFTGLALLYAGGVWLGPASAASVVESLGVAVALSGVAGVACSVLIYTVTHRSSWSPLRVAAKFGGTTAVCGVAMGLWASVVSQVLIGPSGAHVRASLPLLVVLALLMVAKLGLELRWTKALHPSLRRTAGARLALGLAGGVVLPLALAVLAAPDRPASVVDALLVSAILVLVTTGELFERSLFFTTASAPR